MLVKRINAFLIVVLMAAIAPICRAQYTTDWVANTYGTNATHVGNAARSLWVAPEGVIYTASAWDENEGSIAIYQNGQSIGSIGTHNETQGSAITGNSTSLFAAMEYSTTYGSGKVGRYNRSTKARDLVISVSATTTQKYADVVTGLATSGSLLYASDFPGNRVRVFTTAGVWQRDISVQGPGALAVDNAGNIWVAQMSAGAIVEFGPTGTLLNTIPMGTTSRPSALYYDAPNTRLMVGDQGPDMNIKIYNIASTPVLTGTFGVKGGYLDSTTGTKGQVGAQRFTRVVGIGKDNTGNLYVLNNPWGGTWDLGRNGETDLHAYDSTGTLQWKLQALNFEAVGDPDSGTDGAYFYSGNNIYTGTAGGQFIANTIDPITYPNDPRINLSDPARGEHFGQVATVGPNKILVAAGQNPDIFFFSHFNQANGYIAIPDASIPGTAFGTTARIRNGFCLDSKGDVWAGLDKTNAIWHYPLLGFDSNGKPTWGAGIATPTPASIGVLARIIYLPDTDTMILAQRIVGSTDWTSIGTRVEVYHGWKAGNTTTPNPVITLTSTNPKAIAAAGNYLFVGYVHTVPNIDAFNLTTGSLDTTFINSSPSTVYVGNDVDSMYGIRAYLRSTGEYVVTKDDYNGTNLVVYRWSPQTIGTNPLNVSLSPAAITYGAASAMLTATGTFNASTSPTGSLSFQVNNGNPVQGTCSISSGTLTCIANYPTASLAVGSYTVNVSYAGDSTYAATSATSTLTVSQATPTVTATGSSCVYSGSGCNGGGTATGVKGESLTPVTLSYSGTGSTAYGPAPTPPIVVGTYAVTASFAGNTNYTPGTSAPAAITITPAPTAVPIVTVTPTTPQYSDVVNVSATTVSSPGVGGSVSFFLNYMTSTQQQLGDAQLVGPDGTATVSNALLLESVAGSMLPGNHTVTALFTPSDLADFVGSSNTAALPIAGEDSNLTYTGQYVLYTASSSTYSVTAPLTFTVQDSNAVPTTSPIYDPYPGNILNARFKILVDGIATPACSNLQPSLVTDDTRVGTIGCSYTFSFPSSQTGATPTITVVADSGSYYLPTAGDSRFTISVNLPNQTNFISGGGFLVNGASMGTYAGDAGAKTNLGFNVKYNQSGTNLQGHLNIVVRGNGHIYQIKSNSIASLGVTDTVAGGYGSFIAKANIQDVTDPLNPISIEGNDSLTLTFHDNGTPGTNDTLGISVYNGGILRFSSNWDGTNTIEQNLGGGDLTAH
ncbi:MAG TPA: Ig-like domain repeat protein [Acidisarcina sp.]|nr:Ig-like domain repeat protein [Acidisarcina sp.]